MQRHGGCHFRASNLARGKANNGVAARAILSAPERRFRFPGSDYRGSGERGTLATCGGVAGDYWRMAPSGIANLGYSGRSYRVTVDAVTVRTRLFRYPRFEFSD